ncbi:MAG: DNA polymerase I, partial [Clostridia bacterium]|nr:DNA polymerase I [Clostridia bacterium]
GFTVFDGTNLYAKLAEEDGYHDLLATYFGSAGEKITHDLKSAHSLLLWEGLEAVGPFFDTLTGAAVLSLPQDLKSLARRYYGEEPESGKEAVVAYALEAELRPQLEDFRELYYDMEIPLSRVIAGMEFYGFSLDTETLADYGSALALLAADNEERIYAIAGEKFNIHSPKQLGEILFEKMGLPVIKKTKSGYSTDADVLKKLAPRSEIINLILEYRSLTKLKATYADGLARGISERDGRVHSTFFQTGAITGRISSSEPNLQNIPVRTPLGRELRKMFVAPPGYVLVDADYSQIELRLLAHIAGDENMIEAFEEGQDIHTLTASQVFGVPPFAVTPEMRSSAKAVNFGIIYGISDFALAEDIGVSRKEAKEYIERYLESYPGVKQYMKDVVEKARETGFVETLFGRRRYIPDIKAKNFNLRSAAERIALNAPIQGTAADVIKLAMIKIHNRLKNDSPRSRMILQIHEELIVETPEEEVELVKRLVKEEMESVVSYRVTLEADAGVGKTWYEAKQ